MARQTPVRYVTATQVTRRQGVPSLSGTAVPPVGAGDWDPGYRFGQTGDGALRDQRLMFHVACSGPVDCGGSDACAPNPCALGRQCMAGAAPDLLRCGSGDGGVCCGGTCAATCEGICKK